MEDLPNSERRRLGRRFVVEREVGRGGAGIVYRAYDMTTERTVALKVIAADAGVAPEEEQRLMREGQLLTTLDHPGIVKTVAFGVLEDSGLPYVAMEWLDGEDLAQRQRRDPLSIQQTTDLGIKVGEALSAAHHAGVYHRDIKPGNLFLCRSQETHGSLENVWPKIVDFGVAAKSDIRITRSGDVVGTPAYMAPEQARGDAPIDARSDIYSLGATLFELIAGRPPHVGPTVIATLARLVTTSAPRLAELRRDTPPLIDALVSRMLETDPSARPTSMQEVLELLQEASRDGERNSWYEPVESVRSSRLGWSGSRLVTSIVAIRFGTGSARERSLEQLRQRGADAVPLGQDSIVAHLGARRAVGNEAAVALELGRRLARSGARVGIASGRARLDFASATGEVQPVGEVVDRASALSRDAEPSMVLADATTSELGRGRYEFRTRDDGSAIVGEPIVAQRGERGGGAPFVGRDPELAQVMSAFERSRLDSTPVLVSITGPPGIGKSRLRREVMARISSQADAPLIVLQRAEAYGQGHALGAAADVLRAIISLPKGATSAEAERAIVSRMGPSTRDELSSTNRMLLARLLANEPLPEGLDPRGSRDALWLSMTDLVLQMTQDEQVAILMEDLQWADPESIGWIDHMLGRATGRPLIVMALVRPEFWGQTTRFAGRDHVRLELRPVSKRATRAIARAVLGEAIPDEVIDRIADQAGGLPLFAEELARLTASGRDARHAPTIQAAIQVSLDALEGECRDAVGRLSVFGLTCWDAALHSLGMHGSEGLMKAVVAAEVLSEQNTSRFTGTREWLFKHALVRDVAYASLGERERHELHALAAAWLSTMGEDSATVAGHYDLGGEHSKAAEYWAKAAQRALATNALTDALSMAERALAFAEDKPTGFQRALCLDEAWSRLDPRSAERETAISALEENVHDEGSAVRARGARARYDDARGSGESISQRLAEARDQAAALALYDEEARSSAALAMRLAFAGKFADAEIEAKRLLALGHAQKLSSAAVDAYQTQAIVRQTTGALGAALEARRNAAGAARANGLREREAMLMSNLGFALTTIGARQEARAAIETGLSLADAIGSQGAVRHAQMNLLGWAATFGNDVKLEQHLAAVREDADAAAAGVWAAPDRSNLGMLFYRGCELLRSKGEAQSRRALGLLRMSAQAYRQTANRDVLSVALGMWAEAERRCGNAHAALDLAREAAQLLEAGAPSLLNEAPVFLAYHDAAMDLGDAELARAAISQAVPLVQRRLLGLAGTPYAKLYLTELPHNTRLLAIAEELGVVPDAIHRALESGN